MKELWRDWNAHLECMSTTDRVLVYALVVAIAIQVLASSAFVLGVAACLIVVHRLLRQT